MWTSVFVFHLFGHRSLQKPETIFSNCRLDVVFLICHPYFVNTVPFPVASFAPYDLHLWYIIVIIQSLKMLPEQQNISQQYKVIFTLGHGQGCMWHTLLVIRQRFWSPVILACITTPFDNGIFISCIVFSVPLPLQFLRVCINTNRKLAHKQ